MSLLFILMVVRDFKGLSFALLREDFLICMRPSSYRPSREQHLISPRAPCCATLPSTLSDHRNEQERRAEMRRGREIRRTFFSQPVRDRPYCRHILASDDLLLGRVVRLLQKLPSSAACVADFCSRESMIFRSSFIPLESDEIPSAGSMLQFVQGAACLT